MTPKWNITQALSKSNVEESAYEIEVYDKS